LRLETWMNNEIDAGAKSERNTAYLNGTFLVGDSTEIFAEATYTDIDLRANGGTPRTYGTTTGNPTSWFSRNTGNTVNQFLYPFLGPNNEYNHASPQLKAMMGGVVGLNYLLQDAGPNYFGQRNTDRATACWPVRVATGVTGTGKPPSPAGTHSTTYQTINVNTKGFEKAFGPYTIDPGTGRVIISDHPAYKFGEISEANAALIREAFPTFDIQSWTRLHTLDGKIEGPLFQLPAGEMRAAFGFNASRETFYTPGNADAANGLITQQGGSWFDGKRNTYALFAETVAPITDKLELDAAVRVDKYPNFSANVAPKIGFKYQAFDQLMLRGTYHRLPRTEPGRVRQWRRVRQLGGFRDELRCNETNAIANLLAEVAAAGRCRSGQEPAERRLQPHRGAHDPAEQGPEAGEGEDRHPRLCLRAGQLAVGVGRLLVHLPQQRNRRAGLSPHKTSSRCRARRSPTATVPTWPSWRPCAPIRPVA
jgi:hypothetical protein